jgi:hypothetical protein
MSAYNKKPAIVRFIGNALKYKNLTPNKDFFILINGNIYEAYFLEYWEGERDALHIKCEDGIIRYFIDFSDFEIVSDEDNVLNDYEAIVRCILKQSEDSNLDLTLDKKYKVIGRDKDGMYLVMDDTYCCYFYKPELFEIISDPYGILIEQSIYYSYNESKK